MHVHVTRSNGIIYMFLHPITFFLGILSYKQIPAIKQNWNFVFNRAKAHKKQHHQHETQIDLPVTGYFLLIKTVDKTWDFISPKMFQTIFNVVDQATTYAINRKRINQDKINEDLSSIKLSPSVSALLSLIVKALVLCEIDIKYCLEDIANR
uniref:Uncharacterized protein n=1 Tax=Glossina brevipalpis TaxID=37001 RepID=A0A1A9W6Z5_9MUSC